MGTGGETRGEVFFNFRGIFDFRVKNTKKKEHTHHIHANKGVRTQLYNTKELFVFIINQILYTLYTYLSAFALTLLIYYQIQGRIF